MKISHKSIFPGIISNSSGEENSSLSVNNILMDTGYWCSEKRHHIQEDYIVINFKDIIVVDFIELTASVNGPAMFPKNFRIEISQDNVTWKVLHTEVDLILNNPVYRVDIPLHKLQFLKIFITGHNENDSKYYSEIGKFETGISGIKRIAASSSSGNNLPANLFSEKDEKYWESNHKNNSEMESLNIDLGKIVHLNKIIIGSSDSGFPENFYVEISTDESIWIRIIEEKGFIAEKNKKYFWNFDIAIAKYIKIVSQSKKNENDKYYVRFSELLIHSAVLNSLHTHNIGELVPHSSIFQAGIVKFAKDGENLSGVAVQGSDRRLWDGTTIFKGIVQLAKDGDKEEGLVVQASDSRLSPATELKEGIVRLGYDRENKENVAVQGNDSRLQEATEDSFGIVKLCPDGFETEHGVVRGNDSRIQKASTHSFGIYKLAENGEVSPESVVKADDKRLKDATTTNKGIVELADDGEDRADVAVQGNDGRLKVATTESKGIVELAKDGEDSLGVVVQGNDSRLMNATTNSKGIVEFAEDGEYKPGVAVQGNDSRLKDATSESMGIVELAEDGEDKSGVVVQGNDKRLKDASEVSSGIMKFAVDGGTEPFTAIQGNDKRLEDATTYIKGIVELAENGEERPGVVVQGDDNRLKVATVDSKGIVELAENNEVKPGVAVQGDDDRLKDATEHNKGILQFAINGGTDPGTAVQGNDKRLKDATIVSRGIVELAEDGENKEGVVVQGNDKRLRDATVTYKGIVKLAENGEDREGVVVQGNDKRLIKGTDELPGIVKFAKKNEKKSNLAVQADDPRLYDARESIPHTHDYASVNHELNGHSGTLSITDKKEEAFNNITPPSDNSSVIYSKNESQNDGSIGIVGISGVSTEKNIQAYGVVGHSRHIGVRGQSSGDEKIKGCGILGISRFGAGGVFSSEHTFSLIADGFGQVSEFDNSLNLIGNGDALFVNGKSEFNGQVFINNTVEGNNFPSNIVEMFEVDNEEFISSGDLLVVSDQGQSVLSRSNKEFDISAVGVVAGNPSIIFDNSKNMKKVYPVVLTGKALCKVDARNNPIKPGDLIVSSNTPGCGMKGKINSFNRIGSVIGKALDKLEDGIGLIPIFVTHS